MLTPTARRRLPLRPLLLGGLCVFASLLSCGREVTGPSGGLRQSQPIAFLASLPAPMASVQEGAGSLIPFDRVRVLLLRSDGSQAFARTFPFGENQDSIAVAPSVPLQGEGDSETLSLFLRYINVSGDTVFAGGPVSVLAVRRSSGGQLPPPVAVPLRYVGPGAEATQVDLFPDTIRLVAGSTFEFVTTARDAQGNEVPSPLLHFSSDTTKATLPNIGSGSGITKPSRGTATIRAVLPNGDAEAIGVLEIAPAPASITRVGSTPLSAVAGSTLPDSVRVRLLATDGLPIAGATIEISIDGGGAVNDSTPVTDADGIVAVEWTLGSIVGPATNTLRFVTEGWGTLLVNAEGTAPPPEALRAVIVSSALPVQTALEPATPGISVEVFNASNTLDSSYVGPLQLEIVSGPAGAALSGNLTASVTDGLATFNGWTADSAGSYVLRVTGPGLQPDTTDAIIFQAGPAATLTVVSGDQQTGVAGQLIPAPIVLRVTDAAGNRVPDWQVIASVTAGGGQVSPSAQFTDSTGVVTFTNWTLGSAGTNTLEFSAEGPTPVSVSATADPAPTAIAMTVVGSNVVGVGRPGLVRVQLLQPAPAGGLTINVSNDSTQYLTIGQSGPNLAFAEGETEQFLDVNGIAVGTALLVATGSGYTPDTLLVAVSLNLISLPQTLNVPLAQTAALPVSLSAPAPAGGVSVALTVDNPSVARPVLDTVVVPAGSQSVNVTIEGLALGTANITATNPNYSPAGTSIGVTAGVNITATTYSINESFGLPATIQLVSGGSPVSAPAGGITLSLSTDDASCASVPASLTIGEGFSSGTVNVVYGGTAVTPCSTRFRALGPQGFAEDSATVNVAAVPAASFSVASSNLGSGLQRSFSISLGASNHGGTSVRFTSLDTSRVLVSAVAAAVGGETADIPVALGNTGAAVQVQVREGFVNDSARIVASAPGFAPDTLDIRIFQPAFSVLGLTASQTAGGNDDAFYVSVGTVASPTATTFSNFDDIRFGGDTARVRFINDSSQVGTLFANGLASDTVELVIPPLGGGTPTSVGSGGVGYRPLASGVSTVQIAVPGYRPINTVTTPQTVTVVAPNVTLTGVINVGSGLQRQGTVSVTASPADTLTMRMYFDRPGIALLSRDNDLVGVDTLEFAWSPSWSNTSFFIQGLDGRIADTLTLFAEMPGYNRDSSEIRIWQAAYEISGINTTATTLSADDIFQVRIGTPGNSDSSSGISNFDPRRPGAPPLTVDVLNDTPGTITLVRDGVTTDSTRFTIETGATSTPTSVGTGAVAVRYLAEGTGTVRAVVPGLRPAANISSRSVTVTQPSINGLAQLSVGAGLQRSGSVFLSQGSSDTVRVRLTFDATGVALLAPNDSTVGSDTLEVVFPPLSTSQTFWVQALEGTIDSTLTLQATADGYTGRSVSTRILQPIVDLTGVDVATTTLDPEDDFQVNLQSPSAPTSTTGALSQVRAGSPGLTAVLRSSNANVAQLVTNSASGDSVTLFIPARANVTPISRSAGGVALDPLTPGFTLVSVSIAGFRDVPGATDSVNVAAPTITLNTTGPQVGAGLQLAVTGSLNTNDHGGLSVVVESSNPAVLRVASSIAAVAGPSATVTVPAGATSFTYYIAGVEDTTGSVTVSANATGFVGGQVSKTVAQPTVTVSTNLAASGTAGVTADDPFTIAIGLPNAQFTGLASSQSVRAGSSITVTMTSSDSTVGSIISPTAPNGAGVTTITIPAGSSVSPSSIAAGGLGFRFLAPGSTTVNASAPGFVPVTASSRSVTVNSP